MQTLIQVTPRKQMGRVDLYPANDLALAFCDLLDTKVLTISAMNKLKTIGYIFEEKHESTI